MSDVVLSSTSDTAWRDAEIACLTYIANAVGYKIGVNAFLGDGIGEDRANLFAFCISGGPDQIQNRQCPRPNKRWLADAFLIGQFKERDVALTLAGKIIDNFPAYGDPNKRTGRTGQDVVILEPNVGVFEITLHPTLWTRVNKEKVQYFVLEFAFRVEYNNNKLTIG